MKFISKISLQAKKHPTLKINLKEKYPLAPSSISPSHLNSKNAME